VRRSDTTLRFIGVALLLVIAAIHLGEAPAQFNDATYKGLLFLAATAGGILAAMGIWRRTPLSWALGFLVAAGTLFSYVWSRTVGLPGLPVDPDIFEPPGVASVVAEVLFLATAVVQALRG
jgi:hypothetical protein